LNNGFINNGGTLNIAHLLQSIPFIVYIPVHTSAARPEQQDTPPEQEEKPAK